MSQGRDLETCGDLSWAVKIESVRQEESSCQSTAIWEQLWKQKKVRFFGVSCDEGRIRRLDPEE